MTLLSSEMRLLDDFRHQTRGAQEQMLSSAVRDPKSSGPLIVAMRGAMSDPASGDCGFLQHGEGTAGPFRTERVPVRWVGSGSDIEALFEGRWRKVHIQVRRTYIVFLGERITILIEGV